MNIASSNNSNATEPGQSGKIAHCHGTEMRLWQQRSL